MRKWLKSGTTASQNATCWSAIKAGTPVHARMIFTDQNITLDDQDISIDGGLIVNDIFNGDTDLVFGKTVCKQVNARILNSSRLDGLSWTGEFLLQMYMTISNTEYTCDIGYFTGEKPKNVTTAQYINFTVYDRMKWFDVLADDFWNSLTFPKTITQIYNALMTSVGMTGVMDNVPSSLYGRSFSNVPADMAGYTKRDVLGWIAEQCGSYAVITYEGKCSLKWFTDNTAHAVTGNEEFGVESADLNPGLTWNQFDDLTNAQQEAMTCNDIAGYSEAYAVEELLIKQLNSDMDIIYPNDLGRQNIYTITDNPFMPISTASDVTNYVKPIFDRLESLGGYLPFEMECIGDPAVEAGDIITIDIGSNTLTVPIFVKTMRWNGYITDEYETTGQIPRATYSSNAKKEQHLDNKNIRLYVYNKYYDRKSGITIEEDGVTMSGDKFVVIESQGEITRFDEHGITRTDSNNLKIRIGEYETPTNDISAALYAGADNGNDGFLELYVSPSNTRSFAASLHLRCKKYGNNYISSLSMDGVQQAKMLGLPDSAFGAAYIYKYVASALRETIGGSSYYFGNFEILFPNDNGERYDPREGHSPIDFPRIRFEYEAYYNDRIKILCNSSRHIFFASDVKFNKEVTFDSDLKGQDIYYANLIQNSSRDIKHDINPLPSVGEKLDQLQPVTFVYDDDEQEKTRMGLIYEDTKEVMPEICTDDESNKAISYIELIPALLKEIQDLRKRVAELERRD